MRTSRSVRLAILTLLFAAFVPTVHSQTAAEAPQPACADAKQKQLDFWVGEWDLTWPGQNQGEVARGSNSIKRIMDGCVVQENFSGGDSMPLRGMSVSLFDPTSGKWKQTWVDNQGAYLDFIGEFRDGQMVLAREAFGPTARSFCSAWSSRTSTRTSLTGAGKRRKTVARRGQSNGRSTTSARSDIAIRLFQTLDQVQIGQHAMVSEDAGLGIGRHENGADRLDSRGIGRHELPPQSALPGL